MPLTIVKQDITTMHVDVIVNAANSALAPGGGVCGAIFAAAGYAEMARACRKLGGCPTGQAVMTEGFALPAQAVIHTVGPIWRGGEAGEAVLLGSCYRTSLTLAAEAGFHSIASDFRRYLWLAPEAGVGDCRVFDAGISHRT